MSIASTAAAIRCDHVSLDFGGGVRAVDDVSIEFPAGEVTALIGPSGCGKTTLLRLIAGLQRPTSGSVHLEPPAVGSDGEVAFVFQQPSLLPWRTTIENVMLPLELIHRVSAVERRDAAMDVLRCVDLADSHDRLPHQLSGGMKMRVSLARALVTRPSVLLMDEPFAALDEMLRNQLGQLVLSLWAQRAFTMLMVTHNIGEASLMAHSIHVMRKGRVEHSVDNALPWPRNESLRRQVAFGEIYGKLSDLLREHA
ncbi:ABC transporter ATP-binding protein [Novipirellula artificiosorum]|uniref:Bicarbonate transport ATP-binding protein CmpD n=1 Tax=Novipirellula artificiosorum TaxID=2528016 RepID=A0A5C6DZ24_9BACT|nr:ABC transporter ATP-binding protein [Novipirellula artificiosorum]TWU41898.1 Bicarbonate transport ATP-binding protein CmpD [Novipirellula artificiosorum]